MTAYFIKSGAVPSGAPIIPIHICRPKEVPALLSSLTTAGRAYAKAHRFNGSSGQAVLVPNDTGNVALVLFGVGRISDGYSDSALQIGTLAERLQAGFYEFSGAPKDMDKALMAVAWGLGAYKFNRYLKQVSTPPTLVLSDDMQPDETMSLVTATHRGRDLINTPASDMGPKALHLETEKLAEAYGAKFSATVGKNLLKDNYPMIHAVGRAAHEEPRLLEFTWGAQDAPSLAIIGKGVTFDSGGVNMKSAAGMRIMKKDMGGAAHALALAEIIMATKLPVRLHVLLAVAENSVSGNAFRPGDILSSRKGLSVEIDNTDAEGRLVLGDALTRASEDNPDLILDFATLTGAARVALGPTLVPFFSNRKTPIDPIMANADRQKDPLWPMPLWAPYMRMLASPIADMKNVSNSFAGCITAALFLEKFIGEDQAWMHFDVYGWNQNANPARPKGGEIFAVRGLYHWLKDGGLTKMRD